MQAFDPHDYLQANTAVFVPLVGRFIKEVVTPLFEAAAINHATPVRARTTYGMADARKNLGDILGAAHHAETVTEITKHDKPFALVVGPRTAGAIIARNEILGSFNTTAHVVEGSVSGSNRDVVYAAFTQCINHYLNNR